MILSMNETYHPILLSRRVTKLRKETGNQQLRSALDAQSKSASTIFKLAIVRPLKLLFLSPILNLTSLYTSIAYGYLYIMFTSQTIVFEDTYGFSTQIVGLIYLGLGVGTLMGTAVYSSTADNYLKRKSAAADKASEAAGQVPEGLRSEYRLFLLPVGAFLLPIGMFIYGKFLLPFLFFMIGVVYNPLTVTAGWSAQERIHWIVPIIGTALVGCSVMILMM
jgi:hypothetical protein